MFWTFCLSTLPLWLQPPQCRHVFNGLLLRNVPIPVAANIGTQTVSARVPSSPTLPRGAPQYKYSSAVRNAHPPVVAPQVTALWAPGFGTATATSHQSWSCSGLT